MKLKKILSLILAFAICASVIMLPSVATNAEDLYESDLSDIATQTVPNQAFKWYLTGNTKVSDGNLALSTAGGNYTAYWEPPTTEDGFDPTADWSLTLDWCVGQNGKCEFMILTGSDEDYAAYERLYKSAGAKTYQMLIKRESGVIYHKRSTDSSYEALTDATLTASSVLRAVGIRQTASANSWIDNVVLTQGDNTWTETFDNANAADFSNADLKLSDYFKPGATLISNGVASDNKVIEIPSGGGYANFTLPTITNGVYEVTADYRASGSWWDYAYIGYSDGTTSSDLLNGGALNSRGGYVNTFKVVIDADNNSVTSSFIRNDGTDCGYTVEIPEGKSVDKVIFRNHTNATKSSFVDNVKVVKVSGSEEFTPVLDSETLLYKNDFETGDFGATEGNNITIQYSSNTLGKQGYGFTPNLVTGDYTYQERYANFAIPLDKGLNGVYKVGFSINSFGQENSVNALCLVSTYNPSYGVDRDNVEVLSTNVMNEISTWTDMELKFEYPSGEWTIYDVTDKDNPLELNSGTWTQTEQSGDKILPKLSWRIQAASGGYKNNRAPVIDNFYVVKEYEEILESDLSDDITQSALTQPYKFYLTGGAKLSNIDFALSTLGSNYAAYWEVPEATEGFNPEEDWSMTFDWKHTQYKSDIMFLTGDGVSAGCYTNKLNAAGTKTSYQIILKRENGVLYYMRSTDSAFTDLSSSLYGSSVIKAVGIKQSSAADDWIDNIVLTQGENTWTENFDTVDADHLTAATLQISDSYKPGAKLFAKGTSTTNPVIEMPSGGGYASFALPAITNGIYEITADYIIASSYKDHVYVYYTDGTSTELTLNGGALNSRVGYINKFSVVIDADKHTATTYFIRNGGTQCGGTVSLEAGKTINRFVFGNHTSATVSSYVDNVKVIKYAGSEEFTPVLNEGETLIALNDFENSDVSTWTGFSTNGTGKIVIGKEGFGATAALVTGNYTYNERYMAYTFDTPLEKGIYNIRFDYKSGTASGGNNSFYLANGSVSTSYKELVLGTETLNSFGDTWVKVDLRIILPECTWTVTATPESGEAYTATGTWYNANGQLGALHWWMKPTSNFKSTVPPIMDNFYVTKSTPGVEDVITYENETTLFSRTFEELYMYEVASWYGDQSQHVNGGFQSWTTKGIVAGYESNKALSPSYGMSAASRSMAYYPGYQKYSDGIYHYRFDFKLGTDTDAAILRFTDVSINPSGRPEILTSNEMMSLGTDWVKVDIAVNLNTNLFKFTATNNEGVVLEKFGNYNTSGLCDYVMGIYLQVTENNSTWTSAGAPAIDNFCFSRENDKVTVPKTGRNSITLYDTAFNVQNNWKAVSLNTNVAEIRFDQEMNVNSLEGAITLNGNSVVIADEGNGVYSAVWDTPLVAGETYTLAIGGTAKGANGLYIAQSYSFTFTTEGDFSVAITSPESFDLSSHNGTVEVKLNATNVSGANKTAIVIVALYDENNKLLEAGQAVVTVAEGERYVEKTATVTVPVNKKATKCGIMVWDSVDTMNSLDSKWF